jgi:hypothetical protein
MLLGPTYDPQDMSLGAGDGWTCWCYVHPLGPAEGMSRGMLSYLVSGAGALCP